MAVDLFCGAAKELEPISREGRMRWDIYLRWDFTAYGGGGVPRPLTGWFWNGHRAGVVAAPSVCAGHHRFDASMSYSVGERLCLFASPVREIIGCKRRDST